MRLLKIVCALIGAGLGVVGEKLDNSALVYAGIAFLSVAFLLRFAGRRNA